MPATRILWHLTSDAVVPRSAEQFQLAPPDQHGGVCCWDEEIAPRDLVYLGDGMALAYLGVVIRTHGGTPVLLDVEVADEDLAPDPAYLQAVESLDPAKFAPTTEASLYWSGRVATRGE